MTDTLFNGQLQKEINWMNKDIIIKASGIVRLRILCSNTAMNGTIQYWQLQSMGHEERHIRPGDIQHCLNASRRRYKNNTRLSKDWNLKNVDL
jgi:hypothetical protein